MSRNQVVINRVRAYLMDGQRHSSLDIMEHCACADPRSCIRFIRERGDVIIKDEWQSKDGNRFKVYWMESQPAVSSNHCPKRIDQVMAESVGNPCCLLNNILQQGKEVNNE